jgi:hypothetical protein
MFNYLQYLNIKNILYKKLNTKSLYVHYFLYSEHMQTLAVLMLHYLMVNFPFFKANPNNYCEINHYCGFNSSNIIILRDLIPQILYIVFICLTMCALTCQKNIYF